MTSLLRQSSESSARHYCYQRVTTTNSRPTAPHQFLIHQLIPDTTSDDSTLDMITAVYAVSAATILAFQSTIDF